MGISSRYIKGLNPQVIRSYAADLRGLSKCTVLNGSQYWSKAVPTNLDMNEAETITNPGFEVNTAGWAAQGNQSMARITTDFHSGVSCLEITATGVGDINANRVRCTDSPAVVEGERYTVEYWAKTVSGGTTLQVGTTAIWGPVVTLTSTWTKYVWNFTKGATGGCVPMFFLKDAGGGVCRIDDISSTHTYDFSMLAWVKSTSIAATQHIIGRKTAASGGNDPGLKMELRGSKLVGYASSDNANEVVVTGTTTLLSNVWYLLGITYSRTGNMILYVNGVAEGAGSSITAVGKIAPTTPLTIGATSIPDSYVVGMIAEVQKVRGYALSATDVLNAYTYGIAKTWTSGTVVAHYRWRASDGTDSSASVNTLTGTGTPTFDLSQPGAVSRNINTYFSATLATTAERTWEFWIRTKHFSAGTDAPRVLSYSASNRIFISATSPFTVQADVKCATSNATSITSTTATIDAWHHIAVAYSDSGDKKIRIYIDGVEATYATQTAGVGAASVETALKVGLGESTTDYLSGRIAETRISNIVRTPAEILSNYTYGFPQDDIYVVAHWGTKDNFLLDTSTNVLTANGTPVYTEEFMKSAG